MAQPQLPEADILATATGAKYTVERATLADVDTFMDIHEDAARWLWSRGIRQWEPERFPRELVPPLVERGSLFLVRRDREAAGAVIILWSDEDTWGSQPDDAGYIHGLRVRRAYAGQGLGLAMLRWAERQIAAAGRPFARLDCIAGNARLRAYYEAAGYALKGIASVATAEVEPALFEKRLSPSEGADVLVTPHGPLAIRQATPADLDAVVAIEEDARAWLRSRGYDPGEPPRPLTEIVAGAIARGQMHLALRDGVPVGRLAVTTEDELWADLPGDALYVHGLMVSRAFAGQQVGLIMLRWAGRYAAALGKLLLRLDCDATNPALRAYYERSGFAHRGDVALAHRIAARYEKPAASRSTRAADSRGR